MTTDGVSSDERETSNQTGGAVNKNEPVLTGSEQKVWEYIKEHKTPVAADTLAKRFILSKSTVSRALSLLERNELVDAIKIGSKKFYKRRLNEHIS